MRWLPLLVLFSFLPPASLAVETPTPTAEVRGLVFLDGKPEPGVRVHAYTDADTGFRGEGAACAEPSASDGSFSLRVPPGRYFLVGKRADPSSPSREPGPGELFGYYGGNPASVSLGDPFVAYVQVVRRQPPALGKHDGGNGLLDGIVRGANGAEEGVALFLYPDSRTGFRGPDRGGPLGSVPGGTGPDGRFSVEVPPGTYYLTATKKRDGEPLGALGAGDRYTFFEGNPVTVAAGGKVSVVLQVVEKLREDDVAKTGALGVTGIRGVVRDENGKPVPGVFAFASLEPRLGGKMPPFRSRPAGPDGTYFIELPSGGTYFVRARTGHGGPPVKGQWTGSYGGRDLRAVEVREAAIVEGVDITVHFL